MILLEGNVLLFELYNIVVVVVFEGWNDVGDVVGDVVVYLVVSW